MQPHDNAGHLLITKGHQYASADRQIQISDRIGEERVPGEQAVLYRRKLASILWEGYQKALNPIGISGIT